MSPTLAPQTKSSGGRPPVEPPIRTTFSASPDDRGEPQHRLLADSVDRLLRAIPAWPLDDLPMLLRLLEQRRDRVERELNTERMVGDLRLPPTIEGLYSIEHLVRPENEALFTYLRLSVELSAAIHGVKLKIGLLKDLNPSSES